jgi:uncharacterized membrane protein YjdF
MALSTASGRGGALVMILAKLIAVLVIVILGSIAAEELFKFLMSILPMLTVLAVVVMLATGWIRKRRKF